MRKIYVIDLFCGAGGTSTGVHRARFMGNQFAFVIYCVNHDEVAIASHLANHKDTKHYIEDIRVLDLTEIIAMVAKLRAEDPDCIIILWASLECTNFSKAKGGMARDADSRTLAEHLIESQDQFGKMQPRYIPLINPDYVWIENVEEFMSWGPLDENGKPISKKAGLDYLKWIDKVKSYGYEYDYRILNAADFGAYTSRKRYFAQFARPTLPIIWPQATHAKKTKKNEVHGGLFGTIGLQAWKAVKHCLDFSDQGLSIFRRKKELSEKTLERIYAGLIKYIAGGKEAFIQKYNSNNAKTGINNGASIDDPLPTITTQVRMTLVQPAFLSKYYSGNPETMNQSIEVPAGVITTVDHHSLVQPKFLMKYYSGNPESKVQSVNEPAATIRTKDTFSIVRPMFMMKYHGHGENLLSPDGPCSTLTTKDRVAVVNPKYWLDKQYSGSDNHQSIEQPAGTIMNNDKHCLVKSIIFIDKPYKSGTRHSSVDSPAGTITTVPKMNLVACDKWIMSTNFNNVGSSLEDPAPVITANRKHHYIINPSWGGNNGDVNNPCPTIVARQDKAPLYLTQTEEGEAFVFDATEFLKEHDVQYLQDIENNIYGPLLIKSVRIKIIEFMFLYSIVDIKMRMLKIIELLKIQGFPDGYILKGTQADQKKFIGNSVVPEIVTAWMEAFYSGIINKKAA